MMLGLRYRLALLAGVLALVSGCSDGAQAPADSLTIHGSGSAAPALATGATAAIIRTPAASDSTRDSTMSPAPGYDRS